MLQCLSKSHLVGLLQPSWSKPSMFPKLATWQWVFRVQVEKRAKGDFDDVLD